MPIRDGRLRFDDVLETVLAGDMGSPVGRQSAWLQLVDLLGRGRVELDIRAMAMLRHLKEIVPEAVRAASARGLEQARPPEPIVRMLATDAIGVALPILRHARMAEGEWIALLPDLSPTARSVLRNRRDLGPAVARALEAFGPVDFVLIDESGWRAASGDPIDAGNDVFVAESPGDGALRLAKPPADSEAEQRGGDPIEAAAEPIEQEAAAVGIADVPHPANAADAAESLAALLMRIEAVMASEQAGETPVVPAPEPAVAEEAGPESAMPEAAGTDPDLSWLSLAGVSDDPAPAPAEPDPAPTLDGDAGAEGPFRISDVVARIDAFWRDRETHGVDVRRRAPVLSQQFRFETDSAGTIRWVEGVSRTPLIGLSLEHDIARGPGSRVDGVAAGAFRKRATFSDARMAIGGDSDASGDWLISAIPAFDSLTGRFTGYRGTARRPRRDERAEPVRSPPATPLDSLRQLVHELRTPTNAIAGFAEMIETQMLGPVTDPYRERACVIRTQARELIGAIDDLDLAARIDGGALALVPAPVRMRPLLRAVVEDLAPLTHLRGSTVLIQGEDAAVSGDRRAVERLVARLMATLVSASGQGEQIAVRIAPAAASLIAVTIDRPEALTHHPGEALLDLDDEAGDTALLGTGFALRLGHNLARELGGSLVIDTGHITLSLPVAQQDQGERIEPS